MDDEQAYLFDLNGFIVLTGLLDPDTVATLRRDAKGVENNGPSSKQNFGNSEGAVLHWNRAYRDLMAHPTVVPILRQLCGSRFRLDHINVHTHVAEGYPGSTLHGGHNPGNGNGFFFHRGGQMMNGLVSVTYELEDTHCNGGGFCCIPGSHKSLIEVPFDRDLSKDLHESVQPIPLAAGDCVIFTEALIHGTLPWTVSGKSRTTLFCTHARPRKLLHAPDAVAFLHGAVQLTLLSSWHLFLADKYNAQGCAWSADFFDPSDYEHYDDMTAERLAMLEPPNARYPGRPGAMASL